MPPPVLPPRPARLERAKSHQMTLPCPSQPSIIINSNDKMNDIKNINNTNNTNNTVNTPNNISNNNLPASKVNERHPVSPLHHTKTAVGVSVSFGAKPKPTLVKTQSHGLPVSRNKSHGHNNKRPTPISFHNIGDLQSLIGGIDIDAGTKNNGGDDIDYFSSCPFLEGEERKREGKDFKKGNHVYNNNSSVNRAISDSFDKKNRNSSKSKEQEEDLKERSSGIDEQKDILHGHSDKENSNSVKRTKSHNNGGDTTKDHCHNNKLKNLWKGITIGKSAQRKSTPKLKWSKSLPEKKITRCPNNENKSISDNEPCCRSSLDSFDSFEGEPIIGETFIVAYKFQSRNADEIDLNPGDLCTIVSNQTEAGFWFGQINGEQGWFPASYVHRA